MDEAGLAIVDFVDVGIECTLRQLLEHGYFHADPHPGNLLATRDGTLVYLVRLPCLPGEQGRRGGRGPGHGDVSSCAHSVRGVARCRKDGAGCSSHAPPLPFPPRLPTRRTLA